MNPPEGYKLISMDEALVLEDLLGIKPEASWSGEVWWSKPGREEWRKQMYWRVKVDE